MNQTIVYEHCDSIFVERVIKRQQESMRSQHFHREFEIYYLLAGKSYYFIDQRSYLVQEGDIVFINRNQVHKTAAVVNVSYLDRVLIQFPLENIEALYDKTTGHPLSEVLVHYAGVLHLKEEGREKVRDLILQIVQEVEDKKRGYAFLVPLKLVELILFCIRYQEKRIKKKDSLRIDSVKHRKVDEIAAYLSLHYNETEPLAKMASRFFISTCYLSRIFKDVTGFTIREYLHVNRIRHAQELLETSRLSITEIAEAVGYESVTYFEKIFRRYIEISPLKYRKKYQKYF